MFLRGALSRISVPVEAPDARVASDVAARFARQLDIRCDGLRFVETVHPSSETLRWMMVVSNEAALEDALRSEIWCRAGFYGLRTAEGAIARDDVAIVTFERDASGSPIGAHLAIGHADEVLATAHVTFHVIPHDGGYLGIAYSGFSIAIGRLHRASMAVPALSAVSQISRRYAKIERQALIAEMTSRGLI